MQASSWRPSCRQAAFPRKRFSPWRGAIHADGCRCAQHHRRFGSATRAAARFFLAMAIAVVRKPSRPSVRLEAAKTAVSVQKCYRSRALNRIVDPVPLSARQSPAPIRTPSRVAFGGPQDHGWLHRLRTATASPLHTPPSVAGRNRCALAEPDPPTRHAEAPRMDRHQGVDAARAGSRHLTGTTTPSRPR